MGKSFLVICSGLYTELAAALTDGGRNTVWYLTLNESAFPKYHEFAPGHNLKGLEKIRLLDIAKYAERAEAIVTFDTGTNGLIELFRKMYPKKCVFGAGVGEKLETDRILFKKMLDSVSLPVIPFEVVKGFDALRKYLKANPKKVVKADAQYRGDFETVVVNDYDSIKQVLNDRQPKFGIYSEEIQFVVEDIVDCEAESGYDGFVSDGILVPFSYGHEVCKNLYLGKVVKDIEEVPTVISDTLFAFLPIFEKIGYRGALSTENRITKDRTSFFIDPCCRSPLPLGVLYSKYIKNWAEFVYQIGKGEPIEAECDAKYLGAFAIWTTNAKDNFTLVQFEEGKEDDFRFMMACQDKDKNFYGVKGQESVVVAVAGGDTPKEVVEKLKASANDVKAHGLENDSLKGIDEVYDVIEKGKSVGINF